MATRGLKFAAIEQELGQPNLSFFRDLLRKIAKPGQTLEHVKRVLFPADLLKMTASGQQAVHEIERPAHGDASLRV
jgi:hypothetical protein